jgi:hypothetical protein
MINKIIRNFIAKQMAGRSDDGIMITLKDPQRVTLGENILADTLMRYGIDPRAITSEAQLKTILQQIKNAQAAEIRDAGIKSTKSAKVFDLEGKEIPKGSQIMGGKEVKNESGSLMSVNKEGLAGMEYDLPPPGSRGGKDDIAAPFQSAEESLKDMTEAEIKKNIEAQNKKGIENILRRKNREDVYSLEDYDTTNMSDIKKEIIRTETKLGNLNPDDPGFREKAKPLVDKITELQKKLRDDKADGGRIGLKEGMNRRTFLKLLTGLAAVPIIGKVFKPLKVGKTMTKVPIIKTGDVPGKPEWFDQLVNKVILEGDDVTKKFATQERQVVHMKKIDDDTSVTVTQDLNDGSIMVDVDDPIRNVMGETGDDTSLQMLLKKGQADETTKGTPADEFSFTEADMRNYMDGPDDYTTEFVENTTNKMSDLTSDLSKIESYATGKKLTMKQIVDSKKRRDMVELAERNPAEYAAGRGPDGPDFPEPDDFASGGIARMLGE